MVATNDPPQARPDPQTQAELDELRSASEKALEGIGEIYDTIKQSPHEEMARTAGEHGSRIWAGVQALGLAQGNDTRNEWNSRVKQAFRVGQIAGGWTPEQIEWSEGGEEGEDEMGSGNVSVHGDTIINVSPEITRGGQGKQQKRKPEPKPAPIQPAPPPPDKPSLVSKLAGPALIAAGLTLGGWAIGSGLKDKPSPPGNVEGYSTIRLFSDADE